ncbi:DUF6907 domain-containing protein [Streptomyces sp. ME19-01-6]|uniref:DUF6907 domain-containing protein n=1 Tax=Streptomyces sp. ME19-01-6 TaxID=3028686 RepID=UPI0029AFB3D8|nr:hypothetical protein [Streptomyces sp. ME19-01-6]MDX3230581.1 hypothetical protein [Streptomyces sp. ME19-01-6]
MTVLHDVPTQQTSAPVTPTPPSASPRLVAAVVRGQRIAIPCPPWCVVDHAAEDLAFLEDLSHAGEAATLPVRQFDGSVEEVLVAQLVQWPFTREGEAYLSVDADGSGECNQYAAPAALAFADQLVAHAEKIRRLVGALR